MPREEQPGGVWHRPDVSQQALGPRSRFPDQELIFFQGRPRFDETSLGLRTIDKRNGTDGTTVKYLERIKCHVCSVSVTLIWTTVPCSTMSPKAGDCLFTQEVGVMFGPPPPVRSTKNSGTSPAERTSSCASFQSSVMTYGTATGTNGLIVPVTFSVPWSGFSPKKPPTNVPLPMRVTVVVPGPRGVSNAAPSAGKVSMLILAGPPPTSSLNARLSKNGPGASALVVCNSEEPKKNASVGGGTFRWEAMHSASCFCSVVTCFCFSLISALIAGFSSGRACLSLNCKSSMSACTPSISSWMLWHAVGTEPGNPTRGTEPGNPAKGVALRRCGEWRRRGDRATRLDACGTDIARLPTRQCVNVS